MDKYKQAASKKWIHWAKDWDYCDSWALPRIGIPF